METNNIINLIQGLGTLWISTVALIFSIHAFRKVSLKSEFKKKQLEVVFELIEILQDTIFFINRHDKDEPRIVKGTMFRFFRLDYEFRRYEEFITSNHFVLPENPDREYEFIKYSEHPYIPPEIAVIIREFVAYIDTSSPFDINIVNNFVVLGTTGIWDKEIELFEIDDSKVYTSFDSFCKQCIKLDKALHRWLKDIGIQSFNKKEIIE